MTTLPFNVSNSSLLFLDNMNGTLNSTNTNRTKHNLGRDENIALIEIIVQAVILAFTIGGNSILLALLLRQWRRAKLSRMYYFFMHLCFADLCVGFFNVLPQLAWDITFRFQGNTALCKIVKYLQITTMYASTYVLCMTAIDRFLAICHPLASHMWSSFRCHAMVAIAWGLALLFAIPMPIMFSIEEVAPQSGVYDCWETFSSNNDAATAFTVWYTLSIWVIPTIILIVTYFCISRAVFQSMRRKESTKKGRENNNCLSKVRVKKRSKHNMHNMGTASLQMIGKESQPNRNSKQEEDGAPRAHVGQLSNAKIKTIKLTVCVVLAYIVCWSPLFITHIWWTINPKLFSNGGNVVPIVFVLLGGLNSCTNPWIYLAFNGNLRRRYARRTYSESLDNQKNASFSHRTRSASGPKTSVVEIIL